MADDRPIPPVPPTAAPTDPLTRNLDRLRELEQGVFNDPELAVRILEVLDDGLIIIAESGLIRYVNAQAELLFGYRRSDLLGQPVEMLIPPAVRSGHQAHRAGFFRVPRSRMMGHGRILRGLHQNGTEIAVDVSLTPIVAADGLCAVAVIRPVPDERPTPVDAATPIVPVSA